MPAIHLSDRRGRLCELHLGQILLRTRQQRLLLPTGLLGVVYSTRQTLQLMDHIDWQLVHTIWQCRQLGIQVRNFSAQLLNLDGVAHLLTTLSSASSLLYLMVQPL